MEIVKPRKRSKPKENKIVFFNGITKHDLPADRVLEQATGKLSGVVIAGYDQEGNYYFASSYADGGNCLWLAEQLKKQLLEF